MELKLNRKTYTKNSTIGELIINGVFFCHTLEDVIRDANRNGNFDGVESKVHSKTGILAGKYEVIINMSTRFKKIMPLLLDTPFFKGIRIHNGNTPEHTEGCILVGSTKSVDFVGGSVDAYTRLMIRLNNAVKTEKIFITVVDMPAK